MNNKESEKLFSDEYMDGLNPKEGPVAATGPSLGVIQTEQLLFLSTTCPTRPCRGGYFTNTLRTVPSLMRTMFRPRCNCVRRLPSMV